MKIAVVVHGRFFAFELARALLARGHDVTVFTNYPRWAAARFGLPPARVRAHPEIAAKLLEPYLLLERQRVAAAHQDPHALVAERAAREPRRRLEAEADGDVEPVPDQLAHERR